MLERETCLDELTEGGGRWELDAQVAALRKGALREMVAAKPQPNPTSSCPTPVGTVERSIAPSAASR